MEKQRQLLLVMLDNILGNDQKLNVSIAEASLGFPMEENVGYQVMTDDDFFYWYCDNYPDNQFHKTPLLAVEQYLKHYIIWLKLESNG